MISIVMAYLNRKPQTYRTLKTIATSSIKDIEVVIVDDGSNDDQRLDEYVDKFPFPIKLISVNKNEKTWINPCIAYNMGFEKASGDIVIIQNPECMHFGDVIKHAKEYVKEHNYLVFSCLGIGEAILNNIVRQVNFDNTNLLQRELSRFLLPLTRGVRTPRATSCWYSHPKFRPSPYHFTSAISKKNLTELGGFDSRFANGYWYDDDELLFRIRKKLTVEHLSPIQNLSIHQHHESMLSPDKDEKIAINLKLYQEIQK